MTYFRFYDADEDPGELLRPENQRSTPWGGADRGPCDKCGGAGRTGHRCLSCLERGADPECPACAGRVEWEETCPACEGSGEITRIERRGVSAFPSLPGLLRYLAERDMDLDGKVVVEVAGPLSDDRDLDADSGAVLVLPDEVVAIHRIDTRQVDGMRRGSV